jgi:hypothetical protein
MGISVAELEVLISLQTVGQGQLNSLKSSFLGMASGAGIAAIGVGALYEIGKSALDNYEAQEKASADLAQAFKTQGQAVPTAQIQAFLDKNKGFIADQYDAEKAIATAERAGISWKDTQLLMVDALNLSIDQGITMSDAMDVLTKAAAGGRVQLAYLGITSTELTADTNALVDAQKKANEADDKKAAADRALSEDLQRLHDKHAISQNDLMHLADLKAKDLQATKNDARAHQDLATAQANSNTAGDKAATLHDKLAPKLAGETDKVTQLQRHQHELNTDWQKLTATIGPGVAWVFDEITQAADSGVQILDLYYQAIGKIAQIEQRMGPGKFIATAAAAGSMALASRGLQFGGQIYSGQTRLIGESGPELLTMGQGSQGSVTPNNRVGGDNSGLEMRLDQLIEIAAAQLDQSSGGLGYSALASVEYNRSRGIH